jgi:phospholipase D1/2
MAQQNGGDISPTARSRSGSPVNHTRTNGSPFVRQSGLRLVVGLDGAFDNTNLSKPLAATNGNVNKTSDEAADYFNGDVPHESSKPTASAQKPSALRPPPPLLNDAVSPGGTGSLTPPGRRSVQFARSETWQENTGHARNDSWAGVMDEGDGTVGSRSGRSLISKLKSLASSGALQTHSRNQSVTANSVNEETPSGSASLTPAFERGYRFPNTLPEEGSDADAEETADEAGSGDATRPKRKRRMRRPMQTQSLSQTAPNTPRTKGMGHVESPSASGRPFMFSRRATDGSLEQRGHLSEGEGRDRLGGGPSAWRRGSAWMTGGRSSIGQDPETPTTTRRPSNFRRAMTNLGGQSDGDANTPKRPFLGAERATTFGAQRWRMIKHGLKLLGQKKEEHRVDYLKSAELMAELRAGAPAALMLASMIQRDEHGNKRIPVLLEQLKLQVTDSRPADDDPAENERHLVFRIELEYGSGLNRMKWIIHRSLRDFANLHLRYKFQANSDKYIQLRSDIAARPKQPRFPKSAFPYFRGFRGLGDSSEEEADQVRADETVGEATHSESEKKPKKKRRPSLTANGKKKSSFFSAAGSGAGGTGEETPGGSTTNVPTRQYNERQRRRLEQYLQEMIRWLIFRADSNRLCRFLELSAMGIRLAAEGSYHGKEGFLVIQSSKGLDFRRLLTPHNVFARHSPKWFLVRHSYIVCVDSPENMHIYDVQLVDSKFEIQKKRRKLKEIGGKDIISKAGTSAKHPQHHSLKIQNSERRIKLLAKNERQLKQFEESMTFMLENTSWSKPNRFGSFAPVRTGVYAQWLVDGRDYMWNVSRAINMAKDVIYIHDWWLSPQLYMRRPAAISQKWRLDRLLQKKAREGVKVFIIIYRNVEAAIPIDSQFTKFSMLDLHPNVFVQRSPNQYKKNQFFFAHHEKLCIVDHTVAFVGGIDLCFGRWDTPQHSVVDDKPTGFEQSDLPKDADHCQSWPGKDYSNPRVQDFYQLNEPYAEMYDRSKVPRMPWHDISMQVVGQPARDLTRHFVQRWNYVLRGRKPTRPTPFLLPPPDYNAADLEALGLSGTCEVQMLRSASDWSLGITDTEHSIMTAYCKMIEESEHFVYMENQFFITSCETMNVKIVNKIGDAIVERAIRAHENGESWKCVILIPLMPGFQNTVDEPEGTSVRLIMQCQFRSICRGEGSIFGRLREEGIEPEDYVQFYSLRSWGKIGPKKALVTEQLYIHAKCIIVDDRTALIGSANINERSMLGNRDSETAAVVRDTDMIESTMDGKPYLVGRFAHTLRMRLMREHLGLDVDDIMEEERRAELVKEEDEYEAKMNNIYGDHSESETERPHTGEPGPAQLNVAERIAANENLRSFNYDVVLDVDTNPNLQANKLKPLTTDQRVIGNKEHAADVDGEGIDHMNSAAVSGNIRGRDSILVEGGREVLVADIAPEGKGTLNHPRRSRTKRSPARRGSIASNTGSDILPPMPTLPRRTTEQLGQPQLSQLPALPLSDDRDIGGPPVFFDEAGNVAPRPFNPLTADIIPANLHKDCMKDPLDDTFFEDTWRLIAENNTKIFRRVFRCNPDNEVTNWHEYTEYVAYAERFSQAQYGNKSTDREQQEASKEGSGPPGATLASPGPAVLTAGLSNLTEKIKGHRGTESQHPMGSVAEWAADAEKVSRNRAATNASRGTTTSGNTNESRNLALGGQLDGIDEKEAMRRTSEEASSGLPAGEESFPSFEATINPPTDNEKTTENVSNAPRKATFTEAAPPTRSGTTALSTQGTMKRRRRATSKASRRGFSAADELMSLADADELLSLVQGHLVVFPYDWLVKEELNSNWLYQVDQVAPLQI